MCNRTNSVNYLCRLSRQPKERKKNPRRISKLPDVTPVSIYKALNSVYGNFRAVQMLSEDGCTPFGALSVFFIFV